MCADRSQVTNKLKGDGVRGSLLDNQDTVAPETSMKDIVWVNFCDCTKRGMSGELNAGKV